MSQEGVTTPTVHLDALRLHRHLLHAQAPLAVQTPPEAPTGRKPVPDWFRVDFG